MHIVNQKQLDNANYAVTSELDAHGFYDARLRSVDTYLVGVGMAYGWQHYGTTGEIHIPRISLSRLSHIWRGGYTSLRDVLRHEFGHAIADTHRGLFRSALFSDSFGAAHHWNCEWEYSPDHHVTEYAASAPAEDFAETFMLYLRYRGRIPPHHSTGPIKRKWRFIQRLSRAIQDGRRRW